MRITSVGVAALFALSAAACGSDEVEPPPGALTTVSMDHARPSFFAAPWPSESLRRPDGGITAEGFPNPTAAPIVEHLRTIIESDVRGFGTTSGVFFSLSGALAAELVVTLAESIEPSSSVMLVPIASGAVGSPHPIEARFAADGGPFGAPNLLSMLPLQGAPLAPDTLYAAVVTTRVLDVDGRPLGASPVVAELDGGGAPAGMTAEAAAAYREALVALGGAGLPASEIAGLAVFRTDDPTRALLSAVESALAEPLPAPSTPLAQTDLFDAFCVYEATIPMPVFQSGAPPFGEEGGGWVEGDDGAPIQQGVEEARIVVTIPRAPAPSGGYPVVVFSRTGGGGDRPLVDRGPRAAPGGEPIAPGTGPALEFARVGFAGVSVDGPHGGIRNVTGGDEQFLMFNVQNPVALRDNVRQSALELVLVGHVLEDLAVPAGDCPGAAAEARFDTTKMALMGHSMGATITPLSMRTEPRFGALLLSGAGGSYIENVIHKKSPLPVLGFAELLLGVAGQWRLTEHDPVLSLLQWAVEPSDPPVYAPGLVEGAAPRHVLMMQGIVDTYILPPIANSLSVAAGLDLAGPVLDAGHPELSDFAPLEGVLSFSGGAAIDLPASGNRAAGQATAVVVQHAEDGIEDGHEVVFQTEPPKRQYRCFLATFAGGLPVVPDGTSESCPLP